MSRAYGRRYVVQMRSSSEGGSYNAAHRRQGLASVITIKWRALCGAPRYSCIVMAIEGGWIYARPPDFNGELRVRVGFAGAIVVLSEDHAYQ